MTYPTEITLPFADGEYRFFLTLPMVNEFESKHGSIASMEFALRGSIGLRLDGNAIFAGGGDATTSALREVIRCALIGGNAATVDGAQIEVGPNRARELIEAYCFPARPFGETAAVAWRILAAAIYGPAPEQLVDADEGEGGASHE